MENILEIKNLHTYFYTEDLIIKAVEGLSLSVKKGEVLGLVGESACGKTVTAHSVMRLIQPPGKIVKGQILFEGEDLLKLSQDNMRRLRGKTISIIFQEPWAALNPLYTIGFQIVETIKIHKNDITKRKLRHLALELLRKVGISQPEIMALSCSPKLLIADEPTSSLDVTIQAQIMDLFAQLIQEAKFTLILITHNLALCSQIANRVAIMYAGKIVELATIEEIFACPLHPYTQALFSSISQKESKEKKLKAIEGTVPDASSKPKGCHFHPRCPLKKEICINSYPEFIEIKPQHWVSCFMVRPS